MTVKELYDSIGGNYQRALDTMMMDSFITRMLTKFIDKNNFQELVEAYRNKNYRGVFEASHSFKGVTGNLALISLYEKSAYICEETRHLPEGGQVNLDKEIEELEKLYEDTIKKIKDFIG